MNISEKRISANELWDRIIATKKEHLSIYPVLGQYKSEEFVHLVEEWGCGLQQTKLLKTDLCEEAFGEDQVLFSLEGKEMEVFALDVSENITRIADFNLKGKKLKGNYLTADVRSLPFKDNAFDLILSTSTLDHFVNDSDLKRSLIELKRVLNPAGCMIIALNNKDNPFFYFSLKIGRLLGFVPYPCRFYTLSELKPILKESGLIIKDYDYAVHIIGPLNTVSKLMKKVFGRRIVDFFMSYLVSFFIWLGARRKTRFLTGWFLVLKCVAA